MLLRQRAFVVFCASYLLTHSWAIAQENEQSEKALSETQNALQQVEDALQHLVRWHFLLYRADRHGLRVDGLELGLERTARLDPIQENQASRPSAASLVWSLDLPVSSSIVKSLDCRASIFSTNGCRRVCPF